MKAFDVIWITSGTNDAPEIHFERIVATDYHTALEVIATCYDRSGCVVKEMSIKPSKDLPFERIDTEKTKQYLLMCKNPP
jgi:hypothetical protein